MRNHCAFDEDYQGYLCDDPTFLNKDAGTCTLFRHRSKNYYGFHEDGSRCLFAGKVSISADFDCPPCLNVAAQNIKHRFLTGPYGARYKSLIT